MAYSKKRRFVAGAVCPRCSETDKIVIYNEAEKDYRECVSCGFKEEMRFQTATRELETRVNTSEEEKKEQVQIVKILPLE